LKGPEGHFKSVVRAPCPKKRVPELTEKEGKQKTFQSVKKGNKVKVERNVQR